MNQFSNLSHDIFKPLASSNAPLYKVGLEALYQRLITSHEFEDECTPSEAKDTIRRGLLNSTYHKDWQEDVLDVEVISEGDLATRIYNRLRTTGWILEIDDIGYRKICSFSQDGGKLITALISLDHRANFDIGSVCQGVYTALLAVFEHPKDNASNVLFCSTTANNFYQEVTTLSATTREIAYLILNEPDNRARMATFFNDFIKNVFAQDYSALHSKGNPYRYRNEIINLVDKITLAPLKTEAIADGLLLQFPDLSRDSALTRIDNEFTTIRRVFTNIHKLIEGMERYRRSMTRRMNEAIRYSYRSSADIGNRISQLASDLSANGDMAYPVHTIDDSYLSYERLYEPRIKNDEAKQTVIPLKKPPIEQIAHDRALESYLRRRANNPKRLELYIERHIKNHIKITTNDLEIINLDDLLAYLELRSLINYSTHKDCPYRKLLSRYRIDVIKEETTINQYLTAPKLSISKKESVDV